SLNGGASATLTGMGVSSPSLSISPSSGVFGSVALGTHLSVMLTVLNNSTSNVNVTANLSGPHPSQFVIASSTCTALAPGASCPVTVNFVPTSAGAKSATLGLGGGSSAPLSGTGVAWSSLDIGAVAAAGDWSQSAGVFTVHGSGADIYGM